MKTIVTVLMMGLFTNAAHAGFVGKIQCYMGDSVVKHELNINVNDDKNDFNYEIQKIVRAYPSKVASGDVGPYHSFVDTKYGKHTPYIQIQASESRYLRWGHESNGYNVVLAPFGNVYKLQKFTSYSIHCYGNSNDCEVKNSKVFEGKFIGSACSITETK